MGLLIQIVPKADVDAYKLLRHKVTHEARTWSWVNKAKTRLRHSNISRGYIEVGSVDGVLVASVHPHEEQDLFFLVEKFIGRIVAWFARDLTALNVQFVPDPDRVRRRR